MLDKRSVQSNCESAACKHSWLQWGFQNRPNHFLFAFFGFCFLHPARYLGMHEQSASTAPLADKKGSVGSSSSMSCNLLVFYIKLAFFSLAVVASPSVSLLSLFPLQRDFSFMSEAGARQKERTDII